MKKLLFAALLALPLLATSARADGCGCGCWFPTRIEAGANVYLHCYGPNDGGAGQLGPWYLYYPLEAEFQTPAPTGYPYWPTPMALPVRSAGAPAPANFQPASFQPSAYGVPAPGYWGR